MYNKCTFILSFAWHLIDTKIGFAITVTWNASCCENYSKTLAQIIQIKFRNWNWIEKIEIVTHKNNIEISRNISLNYMLSLTYIKQKNNIIGVFNFSNVLSTYLIDSRRPWYASFLHMYRVYFREIKSEDLDLLGSQNVYCKEKKFFALLEVMAMAAWDNCLVSKKRNVILVYFRKCDLSVLCPK